MKSYFSVIFDWVAMFSFIFGKEFIIYLKYNFRTSIMSGTLNGKCKLDILQVFWNEYLTSAWKVLQYRECHSYYSLSWCGLRSRKWTRESKKTRRTEPPISAYSFGGLHRIDHLLTRLINYGYIILLRASSKTLFLTQNSFVLRNHYQGRALL